MKLAIPRVALAIYVMIAVPVAGQVSARQIRVEVGDRVHVSGDMHVVVHIEAHLAINPANTDHLLGASSVFSPNPYIPSIAAFTSFDGGKTWERFVPEAPSPEDQFPWPGVLDAWTSVGADGTAYVSALQLTERGGEVYVWRSPDGGRSWEPPVRVPRGEGGSFDHPVILAAQVEDTAHHVYVFAKQAARGELSGARGNSLARSTDGGVSFAAPAMILPNKLDNQNGNVAVFSDGGIVTAWFELGRGDGTDSLPRLWTSFSGDGGGTFQTPRLVTENYSRTWPMLAVNGAAGPHHDRLYAAWVGLVDSAGGTRDDLVYISWSDDHGAQWTRPKAVHSTPTGNTRARNVMMAVSADGVIGLSWYLWEGGCSRLVFTASADHGETFSAPVSVSPPSCLDFLLPANRIPIPGRSGNVVDRWPSGGDYHGLVAVSGPRFHAFWVDASSGMYQIWSAPIYVSSGHD